MGSGTCCWMCLSLEGLNQCHVTMSDTRNTKGRGSGKEALQRHVDPHRRNQNPHRTRISLTWCLRRWASPPHFDPLVQSWPLLTWLPLYKCSRSHNYCDDVKCLFCVSTHSQCLNFVPCSLCQLHYGGKPSFKQTTHKLILSNLRYKGKSWQRATQYTCNICHIKSVLSHQIVCRCFCSLPVVSCVTCFGGCWFINRFHLNLMVLGTAIYFICLSFKTTFRFCFALTAVYTYSS